MFCYRDKLVLLLLPGLIFPPQTPPRSYATQRNVRASAIPTTVPFAVGETLDYEVGWNNFLTAASVRLAVPERREFYGREAWHFRASAHTVDPVRFLYSLDDQFDSYSNSSGLAAIQFESYIREQGKSENHVARMSSEDEAAPIASASGNSGTAPLVRVPAGTRDPLGFLYALRAIDWTGTREVRVPVYDGRKLYEVRARLDVDRGDVRVPAGSFDAAKIAVTIFERGRERTDLRIRVWLARDAARTPVLIEADLPFGAVRVELALKG